MPVHEHFIRLPKLNLPHFTGNPLHWQLFWDCFAAAVDNNPSLTGVQKLSYLHAQLSGDAARVITGFQLTNGNYAHSVALLREHFGQIYKQVDAHMQALRDLPIPTISLSSLRKFHDATEGHIHSLWEGRGLLRLSPCADNSGKIPSKTKQNLVRAHGTKECTLSELQTAILNELYILEMGSQTEPAPVAPPMASFYTGAKKPATAAKSKLQCPFCAGPHIPSLCDSFKDSKQRCDIVRQSKLCYNCLGHHKVSACNSRHHCCNCQRKHHTSLCTNEQHGDTSEQSTQPSATQQNATVTSQPSASQQNITATSQNLAVTNQPSATTPAESASLSATAPPPQNTVRLLKTAVATIRNGPNHTRAKLLFDEGS